MTDVADVIKELRAKVELTQRRPWVVEEPSGDVVVDLDPAVALALLDVAEAARTYCASPSYAYETRREAVEQMRVALLNLTKAHKP